jgi:hypothetical protein
LWFELRQTITTEDFSVEVIIDYQAKTIRTRQTAIYYDNLRPELAANTFLATRPIAKEDASTLARDLILLSVLWYVAERQFDWQIDSRTYRMRGGTFSQYSGVSTPDECTFLAITELVSDLAVAKNTFATAGFSSFHKQICLPPKSQIEVTANSLRVRSRVVAISFDLQEAEMSTTDPSDPTSASMPKLPNGEPRFVSIILGARLSIEYSPWRAQTRDLPKYQAWATRFTQGLKERLVAQ